MNPSLEFRGWSEIVPAQVQESLEPRLCLVCDVDGTPFESNAIKNRVYDLAFSACPERTL